MIVINAILYILIAVVVFGLLIFVHELGHFVSAKLCGVKVNEFAIGMGPTVLRFGRHETKYSLRVLPIGGFVSMEGEDDESPDDRAFNRKPVWKRMIVLLAGGFMNILVGFIIIMFMTIAYGPIASTTVAKFETNASSSKTGLKVGDKIVKINSSTVHIDTDIIFGLLESNNGKVDMQVVRNGKRMTLKDVTFPQISDGNGGKVMQRDFWVFAQKKTVISVLSHSFYWTIAMVKLVWVTLVELVKGRYGISDLAGPVGTTVAMGQAATQSLYSLYYMVAMIAVNLGVVNLLPLPALDGGRLLFAIVEGVRGKPVKPKYEGYVHMIGFALLMLLMVVVTYNDIAKLVRGFFS